MGDYLLEMGRRPLAKQLLARLHVPLPQPLQRDSAAWGEQDLRGQSCAVGSGSNALLSDLLRQIVTQAGGEIAEKDSTAALGAMIFDGTGMTQGGDLDALHDFFKPRLRALASGGRVVLIGNAATTGLPASAAACSAALVGFGKSLAKELGRKGATCQVLLLHPQGQTASALTVPLVFFLSPRSAFISGQVLHLGPTNLAARVPLTNSLNGRRALVTGAAHGIGAAICRHLAAEGVQVYGHDRPQEKAALAAVMAAVGGTSILVDLLEAQGTRLMLEQIAAQIGPLDLLINNAGMTRDKTLGRMPRDYWTDTLTVNLTVPMALSESLLAKDGMNDGGRIVFMSSIGGLAGNAGQTNYAAAKAGLAGYVKAAAASAKRGITINALAPGFIETRMTQSMPLALREVARRFNSLKQAGQPDDVAQAAVFLTLPGAASVNGEVLRVCGQNLIGA